MILFSSSRASVAKHLIHLCTKLQMKARVGVRANESGEKEEGGKGGMEEGKKAGKA